jgi:hypothetical protein
MRVIPLTSNPAGASVEVSQDEGELMIRRGHAVAVDETASVEPVVDKKTKRVSR